MRRAQNADTHALKQHRLPKNIVPVCSSFVLVIASDMHLEPESEKRAFIFTQLKVSRYNPHFFAIFRPIFITWPLACSLFLTQWAAGTTLTTLSSCVLDLHLHTPATWRRSFRMWKWHQQLKCSPSAEDLMKTHFLTKSILVLEVCFIADSVVWLCRYGPRYEGMGTVCSLQFTERHWRSLWVWSAWRLFYRRFCHCQDGWWEIRWVVAISTTWTILWGHLQLPLWGLQLNNAGREKKETKLSGKT